MSDEARIEASVVLPPPLPGVAPARLCGRPLGEILIAHGALAPERLEEALLSQRGEHAGARLGEILVRTHAVTEEEVLRALAVQLDLPFLERIDPEGIPPSS